MNVVKIKEVDGNLLIACPYDRSFIYKIKRIGGRWNAPHWVVDARQKERAQEILRAVYGEDGTDDPADMVNLRLTGTDWDDADGANELGFCGRTVAYRPGRDDRVRFGPGVVVVDAQFYSSSGSRANPTLGLDTENPVFEVYDVPRSVYLKIKDDEGVELLPDQRAPGNLVTSLEAERDKLLARLAEIEEQLKALKK